MTIDEQLAEATTNREAAEAAHEQAVQAREVARARVRAEDKELERIDQLIQSADPDDDQALDKLAQDRSRAAARRQALQTKADTQEQAVHDSATALDRSQVTEMEAQLAQLVEQAREISLALQTEIRAIVPIIHDRIKLIQSHVTEATQIASQLHQRHGRHMTHFRPANYGITGIVGTAPIGGVRAMRDWIAEQVEAGIAGRRTAYLDGEPATVPAGRPVRQKAG